MFYIALLITKITYFFINILGLGSGYTWSGHLALKIQPNILLSSKFKFKKGVVIITGTNGKTTTSSVLTHLLRSSGYKVCHNKSGANLLNGVASAILLDTSILGRFDCDYGVFEVDEFSLSIVLKYIQPDALILLNLSRDQLDRYGEVDTIFNKWKEAICDLKSSCVLLLGDDQKKLHGLKDFFSGETLFFSSEGIYSSYTSLHGGFNSENVNAAVQAALRFGLTEGAIVEHLKSFEPAYGRGERILYKGTTFTLFLAKNPASFNHNLEMLLSRNIVGKPILIVLNDNIPDGRDVSWIYDIDPVLLQKVCSLNVVFISGKRFLDMAVRVNYSGIDVSEMHLDEKVSMLVDEILSLGTTGEVIVLPNYSAMLNMRRLLTGRKIL